MVASRSKHVVAGVLLCVGLVTVAVAFSLGADENTPPLSPDGSPLDVNDGGVTVELYEPWNVPNPNRLVIRLVDFMDEMGHDLAGSLGSTGLTARLQPGVPVLQGGDPPSRADGELLLIDDTGVIGSGVYSVVIHRSSGSADLFMHLTEDDTTRTLALGFGEADDTLTIWGVITVDGGWPLSGGWTYSAVDGVQEHPASDPNFQDEVGIMLHVDEERGIFGAVVQFVSSVIGTGIGYIVGIVVPYDPPLDCDGPYFYDAPGQSCYGVNVPCKSDVGSLAAQWIDALPGVSNAFKKCMKGRAGCDGSAHNRLVVSCDDPNDCGPCGLLGGPYGGCSVGGSHAWYCETDPDPCLCANTVFHEMSHSCFALDLNNGGNYDAYRIGDWFEQQCNIVPGG